MRPRTPLYLKIAGWSLLNIALLAAAALWLFRSQFGLGLNTMLRGGQGQKIAAAVHVMNSELRDAGPADRGAALARLSDIYGVEFSLYRSDGRHVAGPAAALPPEVAAEIAKHALPAPRQRGPGRPGDRPDDPPREPREPPGVREVRPLFLLRADDPPRDYWLGARVQLGRPEGRGRGAAGADGREPPEDPVFRLLGAPAPRESPPDILLARAGSLWGNALLPDLRPLLLAGLAAVGLSALFWIPFVRGITRSLRGMRDATEAIAGGEFGTRVRDGRGDELGGLGRAINRMSDRLRGYVDGQRRFLGDVAHELCSPIARMQMALGVLEQRATDEQRPRVEGVREELDHMADIVNELLSFSKASLRPQAVALEPVALGPLIHEVARRETGALDDAEIGVEESDGLRVMADRHLLARALGNLLRNAMRYAGEAGPIRIDAAPSTGDRIRITVRDRGPGIPEEDLAHVLDPFYRPDEARTRESGGAGLGLAIVKTCAEACGGRVVCRNAEPGFEVALELAAAGE